MVVCRGQKALAAEVLASIAARDAASGKVISAARSCSVRPSSEALR